MARLTEKQEWPATHYGASFFQFETDRLEKYCPVEFGITCRYLERCVPNNGVVADVGVGVGHYAEFLVRRGCSVYLVDISVELLQAARQHVERAGLGGQVQEVRRASATDLGWLQSGSPDAD